MLDIVIGQGVMNFMDGQIFDVWYSDTVCPIGSRKYNADVVRGLPPIEVMYKLMQKMNYSGERIIDELLALYHRYRNFKVDYLADSELVLGFIGYRGTGKSASIAKVVVEDFLLAGKKAWSNMPIAVKVMYKDASKIFKTEPLKKLELLKGASILENGVAVLDEVNLEVAEATRFMSNTNLEFRNQVQMIRKKGMDVIWSAQSWNSVDAGLRFQSDFITLCSLVKPEDKGISAYWRVMDSTGLSGKLDFDVEMRSHYLMDKIVQEGKVFIRPWWHAYDTRKLQGQGKYNRKDLEKEEAETDVEGFQEQESLNKYMRITQEVFKAVGYNNRVYTDSVYEQYNLNTRSEQIALGKAIHYLGGVKRRDIQARKSYWLWLEKQGVSV